MYLQPSHHGWDRIYWKYSINCAAHFVYNLTQMIYTLDWKTLEPRHHRLTWIAMLFKAHQQCYYTFPLNHYKPCTASYIYQILSYCYQEFFYYKLIPEIDGLPMIGCSICQEWFHIDVCVKVPANALRKNVEWLCNRCVMN